MPFLDFNKCVVDPFWGDHDVAIVGAGAAGILLSTKLSARGHRVVLIESGHFAPDPERQELNRIEESGKLISNTLWCRKRILGGTTTAWGGQSLPFSPLDFEPRPWVQDSGWPIRYDEIAPHYATANAFMQIDPWNYDTDLFARFGCEPPSFDAAAMHYHFSKWSPKPNFLKLARRTLARGVTVIYNAQLTRIDLAGTGRVAAITITSFAGQTARFPVANLILAAGGLETTRILLQNDHQIPGGIGSQSGWLGRGFMEHPSIVAGQIDPYHARHFQRRFGTRYHRARRYSVRLSTSAKWQRDNRLLSASATFLFTYADPSLDPLHPVRLLARRIHPAALWQALRQGHRLADSALTLVRDGYVYKHGSQPVLTIMAEQEPEAASRITLGGSRDRFGQRNAHLRWQISDQTWRTIVGFSTEIGMEMERLTLGRLRLAPYIRHDEPDWRARVSDANHHMGGTRMSASPGSGVVSPGLQVWGTPNLFVCSCSVFPTSSHSNPTVTLLALCSRLVEMFPPSRRSH